MLEDDLAGKWLASQIMIHYWKKGLDVREET